MQKEFIEIGKIVNVRGIKGEVRVLPWSDAPEDLDLYGRFYIKEGSDFLEYEKELCRVQNGAVLLKLFGVDKIEEAEGLKNKDLFVRSSDMPPLPDGRYYFYELLGLSVLLPDGAVLGTIKDILETGANDVYVVAGEGGKEFLLPAIPDVVKRVSIEENTMHVTPLPGLLED